PRRPRRRPRRRWSSTAEPARAWEGATNADVTAARRLRRRCCGVACACGGASSSSLHVLLSVDGWTSRGELRRVPKNGPDERVDLAALVAGAIGLRDDERARAWAKRTDRRARRRAH